MSKQKSEISDIKLIEMKVFTRKFSSLTSVEYQNQIPWPIKRVFFIASEELDERGNHAHKKCHQALLCINGEVSVKCFDGENEVSINLEFLRNLMLVPPGIWLTINFQPGSSIAVLASDEYLEEDYIRNLEDFQVFRRSI